MPAAWGETTLSALTGDWRIIQRKKGHRYSTDDLLTAWYAAEVAGRAERILDLGTGIGSVALMCAWLFPKAQVVGVEIQPLSAAMARASAELNDCQDRVRTIEADLRDETLDLPAGSFDLITATPPYIPPEAGVASVDPQRAGARLEYHGHVGDYARAAARFLTPGGWFVLVFLDREQNRAREAIEAAGLFPIRERPVITRIGRAPFLRLFAARREKAEPWVEPPLVIRDEKMKRTEEYLAVRDRLGMPP